MAITGPSCHLRVAKMLLNSQNIKFFKMLLDITMHASSLFNLRAWQSFSTTSLQVLFGLPLGLGPSASYNMHFFTQSPSSFRSTCPYHRSLFCCSTSAMSFIPSLSVSSFTYLSFTLTSHIIWPLGTIKGCIYCLSHKWTYLNNCLAVWYSSYHRLVYERSYPMSGPVNTGMGHCLWMTIPSRYVTSQLGQLSLASLHLTKSKTSLIWLECSEVWP